MGVWLCTLASIEGSIPSHASYTWNKTGAHDCSLWGHGLLVKGSRLGNNWGEIKQWSWKQRSPGHHGMMGNSMGIWYSLDKGDKLGYWCQFPSQRLPMIVRSIVTLNPAKGLIKIRDSKSGNGDNNHLTECHHSSDQDTQCLWGIPLNKYMQWYLVGYNPMHIRVYAKLGLNLTHQMHRYAYSKANSVQSAENPTPLSITASWSPAAVGNPSKPLQSWLPLKVTHVHMMPSASTAERNTTWMITFAEDEWIFH